MNRRVSKLPGRGLPLSPRTAALSPGLPPPNLKVYPNRFGTGSSRRSAARPSLRGARGALPAGRGGPGEEFPAAFPSAGTRQQHGGASAVTSRRPAPPRPAPAFRTARDGGGQTPRGSPCVLVLLAFPRIESIANLNTLYFLFYGEWDTKPRFETKRSALKVFSSLFLAASWLGPKTNTQGENPAFSSRLGPGSWWKKGWGARGFFGPCRNARCLHFAFCALSCSRRAPRDEGWLLRP